MASHSQSRPLLLALAIAGTIVVAFPAVTSASRSYFVGNAYGWGLGVNYNTWAQSKTFFVGDKLVFRYRRGMHNVQRVTGPEFQDCRTGFGSSPPLTSGFDVITLATPGMKWYFCGVAGHCNMGQKMSIFVWQAVNFPPVPAMAPAPVQSPAPTPGPDCRNGPVVKSD